ncbi:MAG: MBL fold metallo-hydrolase [Elusimicrobia bacterium]|nr:MBL fold metallo-hydrolase [Elusimicrobiota bacterium]
MLIKFWGSRGSIPVSGAEYVKYGGDTACVELRSSSGAVLVVDAGTGMRRLGKQLLLEQTASCDLLLTHVHWDHVIGFPFFFPIYRKGFNLRITSCAENEAGVRAQVADIMRAPYFPVEFSKTACDFTFNVFCACGSELAGFRIDNIALNHPNGGFGYKFTENGKTFVFLTDNELDGPYPGGRTFDDYAKFCSGADLLVHDAEYTPTEYPAYKSWGHSSYDRALELAMQAGVRELGLFHHNQNRSDSELDAIVEDCRARAGSRLRVFAVGCDTERKL